MPANERSEITTRLRAYYANVSPDQATDYLKEWFSRIDTSKLDMAISGGQYIKAEDLDARFLKESVAFLKASIFNLLAFKNLMCENYYSWANVTLYFANFYIANCFLRMEGFAIVHVRHSKGLKILVERDYERRRYSIHQFGRGDHSMVFRKFTQSFPHLLSRDLEHFDIEIREMWNYDPHYFTQGTDKFSLRIARDFCENNFLDKNFQASAISTEDAERRYDLMADTGYKEASLGDMIEEAIKLFGAIAESSKFSQDYTSEFESIRRQIDQFEAKRETREEVKKWIGNWIH